MNQDQNKNDFKYLSYEVFATQEIQGCLTMALNNQQNLLLVATKCFLKIAFFNGKQIKFYQSLSQGLKYTPIIKFQEIRQNFVANDGFASIKIWSFNLMSKPKFIQKLKGHKRSISCLIFNNKEDFIITGAHDLSIIFWKKISEQWSFSQNIKCHRSIVNGLSINPSGNTVISCSYDCSISVIQYSNSSQTWEVSQTIKADSLGFAIQFISDQVFIYQPARLNLKQFGEAYIAGIDKFIIYQIDANNIYKKKKELDVPGKGQICENIFFCNFCAHNDLLVMKNGSQIVVIKIINNQIIDLEQEDNKYDFELKQVISFDPNVCQGKIFGTMSSNGEFLLISNYQSEIIEIRKCFYNEKLKE